MRIYFALCEECEIKDNLKYGELAVKLADKLLSNSTDDKERKIILKQKASAFSIISIFYTEGDKANLTKAIEYDEKRIKIYEEIDDKKHIVNTLADMAQLYQQQSNMPKVLEYYHNGLHIAEELAKESAQKNKPKELKEANQIRYDILYQLAFIYDELNDTTTAYDYNNKLREIAESAVEQAKKSRNAKEYKDAQNLLAYSYWNLEQMIQDKNYAKAIDACNKILFIFNGIKDTQKIASAYNLKAIIYFKQKNYTDALDSYNKGLALYEGKKDKGGMGMILGNIARIYEGKEEYSKALDYSFKCIKLGRNYQLSDIGRIYFKMKNYQKAEEYAKKSFELAQKSGNPGSIGYNAKSLSDIYKAEKKFDKALEMYELHIKMRDSTQNEGIKKSTMQKQFQYEYEKKQESVKAEQDKKDVLAKEELIQQTFQRNAFIGGFALMLILAGVSYRNFRRKRKDNFIISKQKETVEKKNLIIEEHQKEILDSISYAQRIQEAILPPLSEVISSLPNSFILYKPKDIVSGDFYWFSETENKILIAACDCTGHGVPGAFMSTIASEKLNEAVGNTTDVSVILQSVNIRMKKVLRQTDKEDSTHDGMDIALISFNKEKSELEYAGANRPMWIVRGTPPPSLKEGAGGWLEETKATKTAIGGFTTDEQEFTKHKIKLNKGDTIYIFTDGFADQFSPENKKLMSKRFKEVLLSINNKSMEEQKKYLDEFIENWKGDMEQTDDILVIGVRV